MYKNIGNKIKTLAKVVCLLVIAISVVYAIVILTVLAAKNVGVFPSLLVAMLIIIVMSLAAWAGSFTLYGLGQLVDNSDKLVENSEKMLIILNSKGAIKNVDTTAAKDLNWTCSVCGCSVSNKYKTCPFCDYVNKSDHKHAK